MSPMLLAILRTPGESSSHQSDAVYQSKVACGPLQLSILLTNE